MSANQEEVAKEEVQPTKEEEEEVVPKKEEDDENAHDDTAPDEMKLADRTGWIKQDIPHGAPGNPTFPSESFLLQQIFVSRHASTQKSVTAKYSEGNVTA